MNRRWYNAYDYDFNNPHGEVVVNKDHDIKMGDQIMLVSIEGHRREVEYEGFGTIVTVIEFRDAHDSEYVRVITDYRSPRA